MRTEVMSLAEYKCDEVSRQALSGVVLPPATSTYQPIGHDWLLDMLEDGLRRIDLGFGHEHHGLSHDGKRYFGLIQVEGLPARDGYNFQIGVRNALDKRFAAQICFGYSVMVCANLCFGGAYELGRKHTTFIERDLPAMLDEKLACIPEMSAAQDERFDAYKNASLSIKNADHLVMNMYREGAIVTSRIEKVINEWDNPSYEHGDRSVWRMFNAGTQALKGSNIHEMPMRTMRLQTVCDLAAGYKAAA